MTGWLLVVLLLTTTGEPKEMAAWEYWTKEQCELARNWLMTHKRVSAQCFETSW